MAAGKRMTPAYQPIPIATSGGVEKYRDRTPIEVISDGYMGVVKLASLNAVTQLAMESVRQCDIKRQEVMAEHPNLEGPLTGLLYNNARLSAEIQNSVVNDTKRGA